MGVSVRRLVVFGPTEALNKYSETQQDKGCVPVCRGSLLPLETGEEMQEAYQLQ